MKTLKQHFYCVQSREIRKNRLPKAIVMKTITLGLICFALIGASIIAPSLTRATTILTLQPGPGTGKDTFAWSRSGLQSSDLSNSSLQWTQHNSNSWNSRSYFEFDLSGLDAGATITSAQLTLNHLTFGSQWPLQTTAFRLKEITSAWGETTTNWNNQPTLGTAFSTPDIMNRDDLVFTAFPGTTQSGWLSASTIDLTALVTAWHTGTLTNNGFAYYMETSSFFNGTDHYIIASEFLDTPSLRLELIINYETSTAVPEPTTIALLAIGLVGFTGVEVRRRFKKAKQH